MKFPDLNFPKVEFRFKKNAKNTIQVFDVIRKKFVDLTSEEWVRQHLIHYLIHQKNVPPSMISVEKQLILNNTKRRTDIVIYNNQLNPVLIIECKEPNVEINQATINQVLNYNLVLNVPFVFVSNGLKHACFNLKKTPPQALNDLPMYIDLL